MIQLANDPNASRALRPTASEGKAGSPDDARRSRTGHAWPFLSRYAERPAQQGDTTKPAAASNGS